MRMGCSHLFGGASGELNIYQFALTDAGTPTRRTAQVLRVANQFRPEGKRTALGWLGLMNRTAIGFQKLALRMARHTEPA